MSAPTPAAVTEDRVREIVREELAAIALAASLISHVEAAIDRTLAILGITPSDRPGSDPLAADPGHPQAGAR